MKVCRLLFVSLSFPLSLSLPFQLSFTCAVSSLLFDLTFFLFLSFSFLSMARTFSRGVWISLRSFCSFSFFSLCQILTPSLLAWAVGRLIRSSVLASGGVLDWFLPLSLVAVRPIPTSPSGARDRLRVVRSFPVTTGSERKRRRENEVSSSPLFVEKWESKSREEREQETRGRKKEREKG